MRLSRYSLASLLAAVTIICIVVGYWKTVAERDVAEFMRRTATSSNGAPVIVSYATRDGDLLFLLFEHGEKKPYTSIVRTHSSLRSRSGRRESYAVLSPKHGHPITVPTELQLFEYLHGELRGYPGYVTVQQLERYLASGGDEYTVAALKEFVELSGEDTPLAIRGLRSS